MPEKAFDPLPPNQPDAMPTSVNEKEEQAVATEAPTMKMVEEIWLDIGVGEWRRCGG